MYFFPFFLSTRLSFLNVADKPPEENEGHRPNYPGRKADRQPGVHQVLQSSLQ